MTSLHLGDLETRRGEMRGRDGRGLEQTYDTDLEVVPWPTKKGLLLLGGGLFGRHGAPLFRCKYAGDVESPTGVA